MKKTRPFHIVAAKMIDSIEYDNNTIDVYSIPGSTRVTKKYYRESLKSKMTNIMNIFKGDYSKKCITLKEGDNKILFSYLPVYNGNRLPESKALFITKRREA